MTISLSSRTNCAAALDLLVSMMQTDTFIYIYIWKQQQSFYDQLPEGTRQHFDGALTSFRNKYVNPGRLESHKLKFTTRKYNGPEEIVHDFLTELLQRLGNLAFPDIVARAAADRNPAVAAKIMEMSATVGWKMHLGMGCLTNSKNSFSLFLKLILWRTLWASCSPSYDSTQKTMAVLLPTNCHHHWSTLCWHHWPKYKKPKLPCATKTLN